MFCGSKNSKVEIGFGKPFAHLTNFNWVDYWALIKDSTTYMIVGKNNELVGDSTIQLNNPSIVVRADEAGGGLITFLNGQYKWIHQAD